MPNKSIFNRPVRCQEFKIISIRREIRNKHVELHQIPSMEEKSATSSAKVSLPDSDLDLCLVRYLFSYRLVPFMVTKNYADIHFYAIFATVLKPIKFW